MGFDATNEFDKAIMLWRAELNQLDKDLKAKDTIEARVHDLYRNNDLMRGLVEKQVDTVVGSKVMLQALPDYEGLGVSREDAIFWAKVVESEFHNYVHSPENWISADRSMDFTQMCRQVERSKIFTGEVFASREWRGSPLGYNTCFQVISSNRVKSPKNFTRNRVFHGVELDRYGAAMAYHIEQSNPAQLPGIYDRQIKRFSKYNRFGWMQLFHIYEPFLPEYPRGISRLSVVLKKMKQLERFHEADLDKAIITTNYVFAITSDEDPESVADMLSGANAAKSNEFAMQAGGDELPREIADKRQEILEQITSRYIETTGGQIAHLFKGEDMKTVAPPNTIQTSADFAKGHTKSVANGMGMSYELGTGDFDGISFSGGQMSLGIYEHSAGIERELYVHKFAKLVFRSWLDEAIDKGRVPLLKREDGSEVDYWPNRDRVTRCKFTGAKRVYIDPVKEAKANQIRLANGTTSRTDIVNENGGDIEGIIINRSNEAELIVNAVDETIKKHDGNMTAEAKAKIITDVVATSTVTTPDDGVIDDEPES